MSLLKPSIRTSAGKDVNLRQKLPSGLNESLDRESLQTLKMAGVKPSAVPISGEGSQKHCANHGNQGCDDRLTMPSFSSCARSEIHTRAGGETSEGSLWAAETILLRSAARLWRQLRSPKRGPAPCNTGEQPWPFVTTCVFLCSMVFSFIGRAPGTRDWL